MVLFHDMVPAAAAQAALRLNTGVLWAGLATLASSGAQQWTMLEHAAILAGLLMVSYHLAHASNRAMAPRTRKRQWGVRIRRSAPPATTQLPLVK
jgi:hypothetical protein